MLITHYSRLGLEMVALHLSARNTVNLEAEPSGVMQVQAVQRLKITLNRNPKAHALVQSPQDTCRVMQSSVL